ncbi:ABC transporter substrate-binding protein [Paenibacillus sp. 32352]|uniref:ABC transporter substrate-binding protein n=1 Tax=Paenibacillus sp. 32352 TaxID=1969111 RepID=UPI0009AE91D4|nr:extracellular solute-binding protein [Paenibacillus sp. 32352]
MNAGKDRARRRTTLSILWLAMLSLMVSACGGGGTTGSATGNGGTDGGNKEAKTPSLAPEKADLTITSSGALSEESFEANYGKYLKAKFPNYTFKYIKKGTGSLITDLITAGTPIDIIYESSGNIFDGLINPGLAMDITDKIKQHNIDLSRFDQGPIDVMRQLAKGGIYGLPVNDMTMVTFYNKDIFDRFGEAYPKDGMTWEETLEIAKRLTRMDNGKTYLGLVVSPLHYIRLNQLSVGAVDPKTEKSLAQDERWKRIYQGIYKAEGDMPDYKKYVASNSNKMPYKNEFYKEKNLAMFVYLSDLYSANTNELDQMNWGMVSSPVFKDAPRTGPQSYPTFWNIASISKQQDAAMEVIKYLTSDEFQMIVSKRGEMTSLKNEQVRKAMGEDLKGKNIHFQSTYFLTPAASSPRSPLEPLAQKPLEAAIAEVATDAADLNSALRKAEETANKAIEAEKKK